MSFSSDKWSASLFSFCFTAALVLIGCNSGTDSGERDFPRAPWQTEASSDPMPGPPLDLPREELKIVQGANQITDIFEVERFVKLESKPESVIAEIRDLIVLNEYIFISDRLRKKILQFDLSGSFVRQVGRIGEGPGEFQEPTRIYSDGISLVVCDSDKGDYLFFDMGGKYLKTIKLRSNGIYGVENAIVTPTRLVNFDYFTLDSNASYAGVVDISGEVPFYIVGFMKRFEPMEKRRIKTNNSWRVMGYALIDGSIWGSTSYTADIEIYDMEGRLRGTIKPGFDALSYDDFDNVNLYNRKEVSSFYVSSPQRTGLFQAGDFVLACFSSSTMGVVYNVYDLNGNLLAKKIKNSTPYHQVLASDGERIYGVFSTHIEALEYYRKYLSKDEYQLLEDAGWHSESFLDDNPYVVIGYFKKGE